jgi:hypothetical protein
MLFTAGNKENSGKLIVPVIRKMVCYIDGMSDLNGQANLLYRIWKCSVRGMAISLRNLLKTAAPFLIASIIIRPSI